MSLPGYDAWKTETPEDEWHRRHRNLWCEDCEERRATNCYVIGRSELYLCEPCAEARDDDNKEELDPHRGREFPTAWND